METRFHRGVSAAIFCALLAVTAVADDAGCALTASNTGPYCPGGTIMLSASSADPTATYSWTGPSFNSTEQNPMIANADPINSGLYSVTSNGCTATTTVVVNPNSTINAPAWVTTTSTDNTATGPDGAASYLWSLGGNGQLTSDPAAQAATFTAGAVGTLTLTLNTGCSITSRDVTVDRQPEININNVSGKTGPKGTTSQFTFTISLSIPSTETVSVEYYTSNSTAIASRDYQSTTGTAFFQPGETTKYVSVNVYGTSTNPQKGFLVNIYDPVNAAIKRVYGYPVRGNGIILAK